jgi:HAD superfamily hydrolase (TIGR01509 family)
MSVELVILDCDGVLVDSEPITNRMLAEDMTRHGLPLSTKTAIDLFVGGTIKSAFDHARKLGAALPDDWVENFYGRMIQALGQEVVAIEGAHALLDRLDKEGIPYCVASNGPMRKMDVTLTRTAIWPRVEGRIFSAHDVGSAKPDPGLFLHAAKAMRTSPKSAVVIEDSVSGVRAAQAAGMRCLGLTRDTPAEKLAAHGAETIARLDQVPDRLGLS